MASEPSFETFDTYNLTDQESADTERLVNLIREAQCLYTLGHEDDAEELCDELLADALLPAGLRLKVLVLKMSIEQDIDEIEKLIRETENLYSLVIRSHPKGHNAAADEILGEVREALDSTISSYKRQAADSANDLAAEVESRMSKQELDEKRLQEEDEAEDDKEWEKQGLEEEEEEEEQEQDKTEEVTGEYQSRLSVALTEERKEEERANRVKLIQSERRQIILDTEERLRAKGLIRQDETILI